MQGEPKSDRILAIVGGGPSATHLLNSIVQNVHISPLEISIFDPVIRPGGGTPHSDMSTALRVNMVEARHDFEGQISFAEYRRLHRTAFDPALRVELGGYADYVRHEATKTLLSRGFKVEFRNERVVEICREHSTAETHWQLTLENEDKVIAHHVILATGHHKPTRPENVKLIDGSQIGVAWYDGSSNFAKQISCTHRVLILGTGPGGTDVARVLLQDVHMRTQVVLASKEGRLSAVQCSEPPSAALLEDMDALAREFEQDEPLSLAQLGRALNRLFERNAPGFDYAIHQKTPGDALLHLVQCMGEAEANAPAREVMEAIGRFAPQIWRCLRDDAKVEFLGLHKRVYMSNRHAMPRPTAQWLVEQLGWGRMKIAQIVGPIEISTSGVIAMLNYLPGGQRITKFDRLVIATGPEYRVTKSDNPLIRQLVASGLASPAVIEGMEVGGLLTHNFEVVGMPCVYAMGALVHAEDLATTSFPALARHGSAIAKRLANIQPLPTIVAGPAEMLERQAGPPVYA